MGTLPSKEVEQPTLQVHISGVPFVCLIIAGGAPAGVEMDVKPLQRLM